MPAGRRSASGVAGGGRRGLAPPPGTGGAASRVGAALAGPGAGAGDRAVAAARLVHRRRGRAGGGDVRHAGDWHAVRGLVRARSRRRGHRLRLGAGHRPGLGTVAEHGGQRQDGAAGPGAGRVRAERGAGAGRVGGVGDRGRGHLRIAGPDDRGVRAGACGGDGHPLGERRCRSGRGRLGDHGAVGAVGFRTGHHGGRQLRAGPSLPGGRRRLRCHRVVCHQYSERKVMNVEVSDVTRRFGRTQAVAGVTLETGPGVFGLLGPNGAGKTTLLRMMATVIPPNSGRVRLLGRDPGGYGPRREIRRRLGYLPQNLGYYPGFTVAEFVEYFALLKEMPPGRVPRAVATAIERVDLGGRARAKLRTMSGGMLRRAGIAQAIVNEPELLLLDEPTAGLDPEQRVAFRALLRDLGERATLIVSTHLGEDVGAACSQAPLMDAGKIVFQGTPDELTPRGEGTRAARDGPLA